MATPKPHRWRCPDGHEVSIVPGPHVGEMKPAERQRVNDAWNAVALGCRVEVGAGRLCGKPVTYVREP